MVTRIGIVGSTCNPPHIDHIAIGEAARRTLKLDRLILIPVKNPPHKEVPSVSADDRFKMGKLAIARRKGWSVSDMELGRRGKSYTRDTVNELKRLYPNDEIFWIVGSDSLMSMPWKWKGGYGILDLCTFVVASRKGHPIRHVSDRIIQKVKVLKMRPTSVSSTMIRRKLLHRKEVKKYLNAKVLAFIKKNNLYSHESKS